MNNALITSEDVLKDDMVKDLSPELNERATQLTDIIEALQKVGGSSHWAVLKKYVFDGELDKARRSLAKEDDPTKMFRLQGDIRTGEKLNLESLIAKYRNELEGIKRKLNER